MHEVALGRSSYSLEKDKVVFWGCCFFTFRGVCATLSFGIFLTVKNLFKNNQNRITGHKHLQVKVKGNIVMNLTSPACREALILTSSVVLCIFDGGNHCNL